MSRSHPLSESFHCRPDRPGANPQAASCWTSADRFGSSRRIPAASTANPRAIRFTLPLLSFAKDGGDHHRMLRALGAAADAPWVPDVGMSQAELNACVVWVPMAVPSEDAAMTCESAAAWSRTSKIIERI